MILCLGLDHLPLIPAVVGPEDSTACSDDHRVLFIFDVDRRQCQIKRKCLSLPRESAVLSSKNCVVRPNREAREFVLCEMDRVERISLREWILPDPAQ